VDPFTGRGGGRDPDKDISTIVVRRRKWWRNNEGWQLERSASASRGNEQLVNQGIGLPPDTTGELRSIPRRRRARAWVDRIRTPPKPS